MPMVTLRDRQSCVLIDKSPIVLFKRSNASLLQNIRSYWSIKKSHGKLQKGAHLVRNNFTRVFKILPPCLQLIN